MRYHTHGLPLDTLLKARGWYVTEQGCWNWKPKAMRMMFDGKVQKVVRLAFREWVDPELEDTEQVRRVCRNRRCVNPEHLSCSGRNLPIPEQFKMTREARLDRAIQEDYDTGWYGVSDLAGMYRVPVSRIEKVLQNKGKGS